MPSKCPRTVKVSELSISATCGVGFRRTAETRHTRESIYGVSDIVHQFFSGLGAGRMAHPEDMGIVAS